MNLLAAFTITPEILKTIAEIDEFKGYWHLLNRMPPERLNALKQVATIQSVGSSTRIEGSLLSDDEVSKILSGVQIQYFRERDVSEVKGYADLMEMIAYNYDQIPLSENYLKQLHGVLLKYSEKDYRHRGEYKKLSNHVEAFDADGHSLGVIFETASPFETPFKMRELIQWTTTALNNAFYHPLLVIGCFVIQFLAIHPFQDGNGRLSRALTTLLMMRAGYEYVSYCSMEKFIEDKKESYYISLRKCQSTLNTNNANIHEWIVFFLTILLQQKQQLVHRIAQARLLEPLSPLSQQIMGIVETHGRVTVRQVVSVTGANRNTVKDHLNRLVADRQLERFGRGRGAWYGKC